MNNQQQTTNNKQQTTNNKQQTTNNKQQITNTSATLRLPFDFAQGKRSGQALSAGNKEPLVDLRQYDQSDFDRGRPSWFILWWWFVQAITFPLTLHNAHNFRCWLLRLFGAKIGTGVVIRPSARFTYPWKVTIGDYSWIGEDVVFYSLDEIVIGSHCVISQKSYLCTGSHDFKDKAFGLITSPIIIENGAWVATDCFIAPGVTVGANTVIGARSSVFKDIPAQQVAWGNPCRCHYQREVK